MTSLQRIQSRLQVTSETDTKGAINFLKEAYAKFGLKVSVTSKKTNTGTYIWVAYKDKNLNVEQTFDNASEDHSPDGKRFTVDTNIGFNQRYIFLDNYYSDEWTSEFSLPGKLAVNFAKLSQEVKNKQDILKECESVLQKFAKVMSYIDSKMDK